MRRITRHACEDAPIPEEQETEGQRQLHSLLLQQLDTGADIERCVAKRKCFAPAALYKPFGDQAAGVRSLSQFQALQQGEQELASLRELGLSEQEMELWRNRDLPEPGGKSGRIRAAPGARLQRLEAIRDKLQARERLLSLPQRLSASRPLSRREMEIERALFHGSERLGFLSALYHQEDASGAAGDGSSSSDRMDQLYRDVLKDEEQATSLLSAKLEGKSPPVSQPEPEGSCEEKLSLSGLPEPLPTDTQPRASTSTAPAGPHSTGPAPAGPHSTHPVPAGPHSSGPAPAGPHSSGPAPAGPHSSGPAPAGPHSTGPAPAGPHSTGPAPAGPHSTGPAPAGPHSTGHTQGGRAPVSRPRKITASQPISSLDSVARPGGPLTVSGPVEQIPEEEIRANQETEAGIRSIPRFQNYQRGEPSQVLCIKNLSPRASVAQLVSLFLRFQPPQGPPLLYRLLTGRLKGQAFITFSDAQKAAAALELLNGYRLLDKPLVIEFGRERKEEETDRGRDEQTDRQREGGTD